MEEQLENTSLDQTIKDNQTSAVVINKDLPYMPIEEMFNTPEYDAYIDTADVEQMQNLDAFKSTINRFSPDAMGNSATAKPTLASSTLHTKILGFKDNRPL
jgi:hypothetical protein